MKHIYLLLFFCLTLTASAQSLKGVILAKDGNPIEFATITKSGSEYHVHSDASGVFHMNNVDAGDTLIIQHFLCATKKMIVTDENLKKGTQYTLEEEAVMLDQVEIKPNMNSLQSLHSIDNLVNPVQNSQELLRMVPGLFIGQHAGGGKAEQIFLRGFDIDHGTDINISVDGMPVNMVSHAHGQGYADMHFIIPEIVSNITYGKGPYDADKGNFATSGYVELQTLDNPEYSFIGIEGGSFNSFRVSNVLKLIDAERQSAYLASEFVSTDGPFESSQGFNRRNIFGKFTTTVGNNDQFSISVSDFSSRWNASGQIPERAVLNNTISRFGAIDDTEGGQTSRTNVNLRYLAFTGKNQYVKTNLFFSQYDFELYSNFTFFLRDSLLGDQIKQKESRNLWGLQSEWNKIHYTSFGDLTYRAGIGFRYDNADDVELSETYNRKNTLHQRALGNIDESNVYYYNDISWEKGRFQINLGGRVDYFSMIYENALTENYSFQEKKSFFISPKLTVQYTPSTATQIFVKTGRGFHSNDTRVVTESMANQTLPGAWGTDIGFVQKLTKNLVMTTAFWHLFLSQEFVYVGDEAIVELSGKTRRMGVDVGLRYQPLSSLFIFGDLNYAHARSLEDEEGNNLIPLAPWLTSTGGIQYTFKKKITGSLKYRYMAERSANEDASIMASGYTVLDGNVNYSIGKFILGLEVNNILNTDWNETQFATLSRLQYETEGVEEIHFTPGQPISFRGKLTFRF